MANNYPAVTDAEEFFKQNEKRLARQERRKVVKHARELVGPGIAAYGVQITHWDVPDAVFNGTFWTAPGDTGAPDTTHYWIGTTEAISDGFGIQKVMTFRDSAYLPPRTAMRQFFNPGNGNVLFSSWVSQHTIGNDDSLTTVGTANGRGAAFIHSTGFAQIPGLQEPKLHRRLNANQSAPDGDSIVTDWGTIVEDTTDWDYGGGGGGVFTCQRNGTWLITCTIKLDTTDADPYVVRTYFDKVPGANFGFSSAIPSNPGSDTFVQSTGIAVATVGDEITLHCNFQGDLNASGTILSGSDTEIFMQRLSA